MDQVNKQVDQDKIHYKQFNGGNRALIITVVIEICSLTHINIDNLPVSSFVIQGVPVSMFVIQGVPK